VSQKRDQILSAWDSPGGLFIRSVLDGHIEDAKERLYRIMATKPETLTGKTAISLAARARALEDFRDTILDEVAPNRQAGSKQ
jgi:hypothetical protein